uniref:DNA polymerase III subunit gamma/tau n=1 Tax=Ningiella ruwaisensis TaxID=2364274 RepID=UPI00109F956B|nr:DNA polymerase III subunit gamma/tau [Ningiella ruwaisensis]
MSYQVLARKWRPQNFSELVGQQHVVDAITNALENNKLHHAYLFTGTRGVGKTTIARIFSKSLNCEEGQSANPCGKCDTCRDISDGRYVDLLEIDAASRTKVEDTRELLDNVQYRPTRGKYKVYLIDEVHMLSKHSFNALLKTLEEPPEHVKFLLATTDPQKLPVTILSRCLQFSLKALSREQIQKQLSHILHEENIAFEEQGLSQIARAAAGSMRDALSLTDQAIAQGNNKVSLATVVNMLGLLDKNQVLRLVKYICERDANNAMEQLAQITAESPDYSQVLSQLLALLHQIALTQIVPDVCKLETSHAKPVYTLAKSVSPEHIQLLYQIGLNGKRDLPYAPDALTGLHMTVMRMLAFSPAQNVNLDLSDLSHAEEDDITSDGITNEIRPASQLKKNAEIDKAETAENHKDIQNSQSAEKSEDHEASEELNRHKLAQQSAQKQPEVALEQPQSSTNNDVPEWVSEQAPVASDEELNLPPEQDETIDSSGQVHSDSYTSAQSLSENNESNDDVAGSDIQDLVNLADELNDYEQEILASEPVSKTESHASKSPETEQISSKDELVKDEAAIALADTSDEDEHISNDEAQESAQNAVEPSQALDADTISSNKDFELSAYLKNGEKLERAAQIDKWSQFVDALDVRGLARQLLIHGRSSGIKNKQMIVEINESHHHLNEKSSVESIRQALKDQYGQEIEVTVQYANVSNSPYELQQQIDAMRLEYAKNIVETDASIQELKKAFDARVIPESITSR